VCGVRHYSAIAWATLLATLVLPRLAWAGAVSVCPEAATSRETVEAVAARDGATLRLKDGRELRLAGVIAPNALDGDDTAVSRAAEQLDRLTAGKTLVLHGAEVARDRYGRVVAQVTFSGDDSHWLQFELVSAGVVRVAPEGEISCATALLGEEARARAAKRGIWQDARFTVAHADSTESLSAAAGRFSVVEGVVRRMGETSSRTYLDFGRRYSEDFTIVVPRSARASFTGAGIDLKNLSGKRVRVRGVLFSLGGPAIEIRKPASLEILNGGGI
jgi:endonuclease YncB( thermonuclease family)